jgi:hypothetical protein
LYISHKLTDAVAGKQRVKMLRAQQSAVPRQRTILPVGKLKRNLGPLRVDRWLTIVALVDACIFPSLVALGAASWAYPATGVLSLMVAVGLVLAGGDAQDGGARRAQVRVRNRIKAGEIGENAAVQTTNLGPGSADYDVDNRLDVEKIGRGAVVQHVGKDSSASGASE